MEEFAKALETIAEVMRHGARTHPDNDWLVRPWETMSAAPRNTYSC